MVIIFPKKICEFNYCNGDHRLSQCDGRICENNHMPLEKICKNNTKSNQYLKYALGNSMKKRFMQKEEKIIEEKLQIKIEKNEENYKRLNNKLDGCDNDTFEVRQMKQYSTFRNLPLLKLLLIIFYLF